MAHRSPGGSGARHVGRWIGVAAGIVVALAIVGGVTTKFGKRLLRDAALATAGVTINVTVPQKQKSPAPYKSDVPFTMLVMGTEAALGYNGSSLTDSMMVVSYDPKANQVTILSVPRDLWVDIPGQGYQRINTAYENGGPQAAELAVEEYVGVPIEYWAVVNYGSFTKLINDLGCVNVDVPYAIHDPTYPAPDEIQFIDVNIPAGPQCMNGTTALEFIRERHDLALGDIQREDDQQLMLLAVKQALLQPTVLPKLPSILSDIFNLVDTNFPYAQVPTLANTVLNVPSTGLVHAVLGYSQTYCQINGITNPDECNGSVSNYQTSGGADVLLPNEPAIHAVVRSSFPAVLGHMRDTAVQVYNGTGRQGLATFYSKVLQGMGATTETPAAAPTSAAGYPQNEVFVNSNVLPYTPAIADILAEMLNAKLAAQSFPQTKAGVVVILGNSFPPVGNQAASGS